MKPFLYLGFALAALLTACKKAPTDAEAIQGTWLPVSATLLGQPVGDAILQTISLKVDIDTYEIHSGTDTDFGTYTLDATTTPKRMTVTGTAGVNKGRTFPAIYELNGDTLRICHDLSGKQRPTEFKSTVGTQLYLVTYQRKKE